jgi:hypothetical protein
MRSFGYPIAMPESFAFTPVPRRFQRKDGWSEERQRGFIAALMEGLDPEKAAQSQGLTGSGAYQLRKAAGGESFAAAWDAAVALARPAIPRGAIGGAGTAEAAPIDEKEHAEAIDRLIALYGLKIGQERKTRLAGRIAEADFYCRQLTFLEVALTLGAGGFALLQALRGGGYGVLDVAATAMSSYLEEVRRGVWREKGEADRPPPSLVAHLTGEHEEIGLAHHCAVHRQPGESWQQAIQRQDERARILAEAQAQWEARARADAEAWAAREGMRDGTPDG